MKAYTFKMSEALAKVARDDLSAELGLEIHLMHNPKARAFKFFCNKLFRFAITVPEAVFFATDYSEVVQNISNEIREEIQKSL